MVMGRVTTITRSCSRRRRRRKGGKAGRRRRTGGRKGIFLMPSKDDSFCLQLLIFVGLCLYLIWENIRWKDEGRL